MDAARWFRLVVALVELSMVVVAFLWFALQPMRLDTETLDIVFTTGTSRTTIELSSSLVTGLKGVVLASVFYTTCRIWALCLSLLVEKVFGADS